MAAGVRRARATRSADMPSRDSPSSRKRRFLRATCTGFSARPVFSSRNSSNSKRLVEVSENSGVPAYLVDDAGEVDPGWLKDVNTVAVTAGASAPEHLVQELLASLRVMGFGTLKELAVKEEDVRFLLPPELAHVPASPVTVNHP